MARRKKEPPPSAGFVPLTEQEERDLAAFLATVDEPFRRDLRAMLDEHARWTQADADYRGFSASVEARHIAGGGGMRPLKQYDPLARLVVAAEQRETVAVRGAMAIAFSFGFLAALGTKATKPAVLERMRGMLERHATIAAAPP